jgi:amidase
MDSAGPMAKTPYDVAMLLDYLVSPETRDTQESYTTAVTASWEGIGIATLDPEKWKFPPQFIRPVEEATLQIV